MIAQKIHIQKSIIYKEFLKNFHEIQSHLNKVIYLFNIHFIYHLKKNKNF
jgi:hypothetical protein